MPAMVDGLEVSTKQSTHACAHGTMDEVGELVMQVADWWRAISRSCRHALRDSAGCHLVRHMDSIGYERPSRPGCAHSQSVAWFQVHLQVMRLIR